jgi:hypothetical protein
MACAPGAPEEEHVPRAAGELADSPSVEAPEAVGDDVLFEFTIELTVSEGQPPPALTDIKLYEPNGTAYADFNSRFVWTEIPQYTEHVSPFVIANEGDVDVTAIIVVVDSPTWATFTVEPSTIVIYAGSSADATWTMTIAGQAPVGAQAVVKVRGLQG